MTEEPSIGEVIEAEGRVVEDNPKPFVPTWAVNVNFVVESNTLDGAIDELKGRITETGLPFAIRFVRPIDPETWEGV